LDKIADASNLEIMRAAILATDKEAKLDSETPDYIRGRFYALTKVAAIADGGKELGEQIISARLDSVSDPEMKSRQDHEKKLTSRWQA